MEEWDRVQQHLRSQVILSDVVGFSLDPQDTARPLLQRVGGVDVSFFAGPRDDSCGSGTGGGERAVAGLVVLSYPGLQVLYEDYEDVHVAAPYVPNYLAFREVPLYLPLLQRAAATPFAPQVVLLDGCGTLHPRRFGAACHLGVLAGIPTIGVAKNLLHVEGITRQQVEDHIRRVRIGRQGGSGGADDGGCSNSIYGDDVLLLHGCNGSVPDASTGIALGQTAAPAACTVARLVAGAGTASTAAQALPGGARGDASCAAAGAASSAPLHTAAVVALSEAPDASAGAAGGAVLGAALITPRSARPLYVSAGHRISLPTAVELVRRCCAYRIPEPIRQADLRTRERVRQLQAQPARPAP